MLDIKKEKYFSLYNIDNLWIKEIIYIFRLK